MPTKLKLIPLMAVGLVALLAAACGGADGSEDDAGVFGDFGEDELYVSAGAEVLSASAQQFDEEITSMEGEMEIAMNGFGGDISGDAEFAFKSPDQMYLAMDLEGDGMAEMEMLGGLTFEVLVRDETMYMKMPLFGTEWIEMSFDDPNADFTGMQDILSEGSAFDYKAFVEGIDGVEFAGEEEIDGKAMLHYEVSLDISEAWEAFGESLDTASPELTEELSGVSGPIRMDLWLGKSDFLPYRMVLDSEITADGMGTMAMDFTMSVHGYNTDVTIPEAPEDTISFEEVFGDLFGDAFSEEGWSEYTEE